MRMRKPVLLVAIILFACLSAKSQRYALRNYVVKDGLPQSQVSPIQEDENGYLWLGTMGGGLTRFDGRNFKVYTTRDGLLNNIVTSLLLDNGKNLWIAHPNGISCFNGIGFKTYRPADQDNQDSWVRRVFLVGDSIFAISMNGRLGTISSDSTILWKTPAQNVEEILYCFRTPGGSAVLYRNDSSLLIKSPEGDRKIPFPDGLDWLGSMFSKGDEIWANSKSGLYKFENDAFKKIEYPVKNHVIFYDKVNDVFWTISGKSLLKESVRDNRHQVDTVLQGAQVTNVAVDAEGDTWIATSGMGIFKYFKQDFFHIGDENLGVVMAVFKDSHGDLWAGSSTRGLWRFHNGEARSYINEEGSYYNTIHSINESPDGTLWVAGQAGLARYDRANDKLVWVTDDVKIPFRSVVGLAFDKKGGVWMGTFNKGVSYFDGKTFTNYSQDDNGHSIDASTVCYVPETGELFIGMDSGLGALKNGKFRRVPIPLENAGIISISQYRKDYLMLGSAGSGIVIHNLKTGVNKEITSSEGLPSDFIYFVAPDEEGYIWVGTEKGITRLRLDEKLNVTENFHYDDENGLTGVETNQNAYFLGRGGRYFGLIDGLYEFDNSEGIAGKSFDVHLTDVNIFYGAYSARSYSDSLAGFYKIPVSPVLPSDKNHITFAFNRVDKRYPKSVKFMYQLDNFDKTWSPPSSTGQVTYSNLPPGDYVFKVQATNNLGSWDNRQLQYAFTIKAPFYKTPAFYAGGALLIVGIVFFVMYLKVKNRVDQIVLQERIRTEEHEILRKEIARDFHDEMGNQLSRIINYVSQLKMGNGNASTSKIYSKVEDSAKYLYSGTRDFIWAIDPVNDELSKLFIHIRDFGEKLFSEKEISFRAFNDVKQEVKLPYGFSREANLIFKEIMTNAFKHSAAKNVNLTLTGLGDQQYTLQFEDDGIGFADTGSDSNGLKNIRERAQKINSMLEIFTGPIKGTKISLEINIYKHQKHGVTI